MTIPFEISSPPGSGIRVEHFSFLAALVLFLLLTATGVPSLILGRGTPTVRQTLRLMGETDPESLAIRRSQASYQAPSLGQREQEQPDFQTSRSHRVLEGETLSRISGIYGLRPETILAVNQKEDPRRIRAGMELVIPLTDGFPYRVERRDTPERIADRLLLNGENRELFLSTWATLPAPGKVIFVPGDSPLLDRYRRNLQRFYLYPVTGTVITSFGETTDPVTGLKTFYEGIDITAARGTPVRASREGLVVRVQIHQALGYCVILRHDDGMTTLYGQLEEPAVVEGVRVEQGSILGLVGNKVYGKVDHLFFSMKKNGRVIDPLSVLY